MLPFHYPGEYFTFPPVENARKDPDGLLAAGGDLSTKQLLDAYQNAIFPWFSDSDPILWWSPSIRGVFWPNDIHVSRSLAKFLRKAPYHYSFNRHFAAVIQACSDIHGEKTGTWITKEMLESYNRLHQLGHAHSVEVWQGTTLVGGLYGILVGQVFCGESMFHTADHASKCALLALSQHLLPYGLQLIDCQIPNPHLMRLGASEMPRAEFVQYLTRFQQVAIQPEALKPQPIPLKSSFKRL